MPDNDDTSEVLHRRRRLLLQQVLTSSIPTLALGIAVLTTLVSVSSPDNDPPPLDLTVAASSDSAHQWSLTGRVLIPETGHGLVASVWATIVDREGNRYPTPLSVTDSAGYFRIAPLPLLLSSDSLRGSADIVVTAVAVHFDTTSRRRGLFKKVAGLPRRASETLHLAAGGPTRWVQIPTVSLLGVGLPFLLSMLVGIARVSGRTARTLQYYVLAALSVALTIAILAYLIAGLRAVTSSASRNQVLALGFATVHFGSFVDAVAPEWLISITSPYSVQSAAPGTLKGFGAPLWVLLLSTIGGALFTVTLLLKNIASPPDVDEGTGYRARLEELARHQFYMLFAPLGAVFVYQLLVVAGAAHEQVTVAIASLAAGVALNFLLNRALKTVQQLLQ